MHENRFSTILAWNRHLWTPCQPLISMATEPPHGAEQAAGQPNAALERCTRPLHRCDTVGKLIVYYRELKGWGQKQLLYATGLTQSRLSSLERGTRKPKWEELDRISFFLEQPSDAFSMLRRHATQQPPAGTEPTMPGL